MILEKLIIDYLAIPSAGKHGFGFRLKLAQIDSIAAKARYNYAAYLGFFIMHMIQEENNASILNNLIKTYGGKLSEDKEQRMIISLYKRYLQLDPTNESTYKQFAEIIALYGCQSENEKAEAMYKYAENQNYTAAQEILNLIK